MRPAMVVTVAAVAIFNACQSSPTAPPSMAAGTDTAVLPLQGGPYAPGSPMGPAIVTGCTWTNELGEVIGEWGNRLPGSGTAYPNPTTGNVILPFQLVKDTEVSWWIEKAYGPGEEISDNSNPYAGATLVPANRILLGPQVQFLTTGNHRLGWNGRDANGILVANGYYRAYIHIPDLGVTGWWDVLIKHD